MAKPFLIIQHVESENPGMFSESLERLEVKTHLVRLDASEPLPEQAAQVSGVLIMGGPMNVGESFRYPFLEDEMRFIRNCREAGVPVLGICLGAQLIAASFGARVYEGEIKEIGWYDVWLTREGLHDRLLGGCPQSFKVFQSHGQTFDLPPGAVRLAGSTNYENQAFRLAHSLWGLQFHLEATADHIRCWLEENSRWIESLPYIDPEQILAEIPKYEIACQKLAVKLFERFLEVALHNSGGRT